MPSLRFAAAAAIASALLLAAAIGANAAAPGTTTVSIDKLMFGPMAVTVPAGAAVSWVNHQ